MVRGAGERPAGLGHATDRRGQLRAILDEERQVEEPGRAVRSRVGGRAVEQLDERRAAPGAEDDAVMGPLEHDQADRELVEARHRVEVADAQAHPAEPCLWIDARGLHAREASARHPSGR